ncbi:hypothetical protein [Planotetraspora sp. GP83]|uniref:hypothetical protein n=1 Tax=Planotetraspora sp. GP83 TaxID=3156264 RepID=UPI00351736BE
MRGRDLDARVAGSAGAGLRGAGQQHPTVSDERVEQVVVDTLESTPVDGTHWSRAPMAKRSGLSPSTVGRLPRGRARR